MLQWAIRYEGTYVRVLTIEVLGKGVMVRVQLQRHKVHIRKLSLIESQVCSLILYFFTFIEPTSANCFLCGSTKIHLYSFINCPPARHLKKKFSRLVRKVAAILLCEKKRFCDVSKLICLPRFSLESFNEVHLQYTVLVHTAGAKRKQSASSMY